MRSNQIRTIQKRAKRRVLALAICAVAFAGYNAISLFADDTNVVTKTVTEMNKVPALRSVGIRLINSSGSAADTQTSMEKLLANNLAGNNLAGNTGAMQSSQHLPNAILSEPNSMLPEPSSVPNTLLPKASMPVELNVTTMPIGVALQTPEMNLPPISSYGRSELQPPPPMTDLLNQSTHGRVLVRLSSDKPQPSSDSAGARSVQQLQAGKPTKSKTQVLNNAYASTAVPEVATIAAIEPIRVSFGDGVNSEIPTGRSVASAPASVVKNRVPEQVKPKPTQIVHTVSLAQSTEIDLQASEHRLFEDSTMSPATVAVREQLPPQSLPKTRTDSRSNAKTSPVGFVSLAPPSLSEFGESPLEVNQVGGATPPTKFDSRWAKGSPSAIVELESQSAKALDIPGVIKAITVENEDVCRVLHNATTISLVGKHSGSTLVQIWTSEAKATPILVRVNVSQPWQKTNSKPADVQEVKNVVAQAFPNAKINVFTNADGTLEVRGTTDNEDSARRILEIVRKLCLVPVKDKVTVSR